MSDRLERSGRVRVERGPQRISEGIPTCGGPRCRRYRRVDGTRWEDHERATCPAEPHEEMGIGWLDLALVFVSIALASGLFFFWVLTG